MKTYDSVLKCACDISETHFIEETMLYYNTKPSIKYSRNFRKKIKRLCNETEKSYSKLRRGSKTVRTMLIAAILIVLLSISAFAITPVRDRIKNFFIKENANSSEIVFLVDNFTSGTLYSDYAWLPCGYALYEKSCDKFGELIIFKDKEGHSICCISEKTNGYEGPFINTEGIKAEEIVINGILGVYFENKGMRTVLWGQGKFNYYIDAECECVSKEELIKVAENRHNK